MNIILASASPRRNEIFKLITEDFKVIPADIKEDVPDGFPPDKAVLYLAEKKASSVFEKYFRKNEEEAIIIGCDTIVSINQRALGKPRDETDAENMLELLSGKKHTVITGCCIFHIKNKKSKKVIFNEKTEVEFYPLTNDEIKNYVKTGEPFDKAGAYGIQSKGALLVKKIKGDYFNVVGLPAARLKRKLDKITGGF